MLQIRYADVRDAEDLAYIYASSWKAAYRGIIPEQVLKNITPEKREKYFKKVLAEKSEENALIFMEDYIS